MVMSEAVIDPSVLEKKCSEGTPLQVLRRRNSRHKGSIYWYVVRLSWKFTVMWLAHGSNCDCVCGKLAVVTSRVCTRTSKHDLDHVRVGGCSCWRRVAYVYAESVSRWESFHADVVSLLSSVRSVIGMLWRVVKRVGANGQSSLCALLLARRGDRRTALCAVFSIAVTIPAVTSTMPILRNCYCVIAILVGSHGYARSPQTKQSICYLITIWGKGQSPLPL